MRLLPITILVLLCAQAMPALNAQCLRTLTPSVGDQLGTFGLNAEVFGDTAVVNAFGYPVPSGGTGALWVYEWNGANWEETQILTPSMPVTGFGFSFALDGENLIVSAPYDGASPLFVFRRVGDDWIETQTIPFPSGVFTHGLSIKLDGERMIVGSPGPRTFVTTTGSARIYEFNGSQWDLASEVPVAPNGEVNIGEDVALDGDRVVVGATGAGPDNGEVHVLEYDGSTWTVEQIIPAPAILGSDDQFGASVAVSDDTILVGAPEYEGDEGRVFRYRFDGADWQLETELESTNSFQFFGLDVRIIEEMAFAAGAQRLQAYRKSSDTWIDDFSIDSPYFSPEIGTDGVRVILPQPEIDLLTPELGQAFIFDIACLSNTFTRGDFDGDGEATFDDAVAFLVFLLAGGEAPECEDAADADDNGTLELTDAVTMLNYFFVSGPALPAPFPSCGEDTSPDTLSCTTDLACP